MIRGATPEDWAVIVGEIPGYMVPMWGGVIEEDGAIVGHAFFSKIADRVWAHNLAYQGSDPMAVARLFQFGRSHFDALGIGEFFTEVDPRSRIREFYTRRGFQEHSIVLRGQF